MRYQHNTMNHTIAFLFISSLISKIRWGIGRLYFSNNHLVHEIFVLYRDIMSCKLKLQSSEPYIHTSSISVQCDTKYRTIVILTLAVLVLVLYTASRQSNIILKPFLLLIMKLSICVISVLMCSEDLSTQIFKILLLEFRLVSLIYGTIFFICRIFLSGISFVIGFTDKSDELPIW